MAVFLSPVGGAAAQFFDNDGVPLAGGLIYTYTAGTSTPAATYTTSSGIIQHSNPIILDAAGRVPTGEIWLSDTLAYKFVIKTDQEVLIATYDNINGINSNFVAYTSQQEIQTATAGQTVFNLATMQYQPGTNNLSVFVDGVNQYGPGAQYAYVETDSDTVTFVTGLHVGASVKFTTASPVASAVVNAENVAYTPPFSGSVTTNVEAKLAQYVSVKDFGAVGDGVTDDTVAIQNAIDYCLANNKGLSVVGLCYITSSLIINRLVDTQTSEFCISAQGSKQGFLVNDGVTLFDSTLPFTTQPQSELVRFFGVHFEAKTPTNASTFVLSKKFLRIDFESCHFEAIKCMLSDIYTQTIYFLNCTIRNWKNGYFYKTAGCYDISFIGNVVEAGDYFFNSVNSDGVTGCAGTRFIGNVIEGQTGTCLELDGCRGVLITGNYFEGIVNAPFLNMYSGTIPHHGLEISANWFQTNSSISTHYAIYWGPVNYGTTCNNYCNGKLHNNADLPYTNLKLSSYQEVATGTLWKIPRGNKQISLIAQPITLITSVGGPGSFILEANNYSTFQLSCGVNTGNNVNSVVAGYPGQRISVQILNNSVSAITSFTFPASFKTSSWTTINVNHYVIIDFIFDGSVWYEASKTSEIAFV